MTHVQSHCIANWNLLFCGILVAIAVVIAKGPYKCQGGQEGVGVKGLGSQ